MSTNTTDATEDTNKTYNHPSKKQANNPSIELEHYHFQQTLDQESVEQHTSQAVDELLEYPYSPHTL